MIKFLDLHKVNQRFETAFKQAFDAFLNSGSYVLGDAVSNFEHEFATYCGTQHCVGISNGLDAIKLIFEGYKVLGRLKEGDEVIVPANTYIASILGVTQAGLTPVFVDPDLDTYNIDPERIQQHISKNTKAILVVHLYGQLCEMKAIQRIAKANDLLVVEDAAQAHGAEDDQGTKAGNLGDAAAFSFYPTKNLGALGEAGAITTNDHRLSEVVAKLRNYGTSSKYINDHKGFNHRIDPIQALFLSIKLKELDADNDRRRAVARQYMNGIKNERISLPNYSVDKDHVFHLHVIRSEQRDALQKHLEENGIQTLIHYPIPPHQQQAYIEYRELQLPITEKIHQQVLSLPISPIMEVKQVEDVINAVNRF